MYWVSGWSVEPAGPVVFWSEMFEGAGEPGKMYLGASYKSTLVRIGVHEGSQLVFRDVFKHRNIRLEILRHD